MASGPYTTGEVNVEQGSKFPVVRTISLDAVEHHSKVLQYSFPIPDIFLSFYVIKKKEAKLFVQQLKKKTRVVMAQLTHEAFTTYTHLSISTSLALAYLSFPNLVYLAPTRSSAKVHCKFHGSNSIQN